MKNIDVYFISSILFTDVQSLSELNQLVEEWQDADLSIQSFKDIACAPNLKELTFNDETLELDICSDLQSLAAVSKVIAFLDIPIDHIILTRILLFIALMHMYIHTQFVVH